MDALCVACGTEVRPRQHGLDCDRCTKWTHRICGTENVLESVTKKMEAGEGKTVDVGLGTKDNTTADQEKTQNTNTEKQGAEASLEDLLGSLHSQLKQNPDWLKENTADKWVAENPELAEEYMKAMKQSQTKGGNSS